jgi:hypothetical protein
MVSSSPVKKAFASAFNRARTLGRSPPPLVAMARIEKLLSKMHSLTSNLAKLEAHYKANKLTGMNATKLAAYEKEYKRMHSEYQKAYKNYEHVRKIFTRMYGIRENTYENNLLPYIRTGRPLIAEHMLRKVIQRFKNKRSAAARKPEPKKVHVIRKWGKMSSSKKANSLANALGKLSVNSKGVSKPKLNNLSKAFGKLSVRRPSEAMQKAILSNLLTQVPKHQR